MNYSIAFLFILFIMYSFVGWSIEVVGILITKGKFVNRGFLLGPYCPVYGFGGILMVLLLSRYIDDVITLFIMCILLFSILEYITSFIMEKLFNARWWDYTKYKFNINGRICLETMVPFGFCGIFFMYVVNPFLISLINKIPDVILIITSLILFVLLVIDISISSNTMIKIKGTIKNVKKDNTEEITNKVKELIMQKGYIKNRIIKAFPKLKVK
ncbi:MAG: putative ABC transporter permease [Bacilli bacterium]|nr:putative ABC transporter permease [Bacilli bacterium]